VLFLFVSRLQSRKKLCNRSIASLKFPVARIVKFPVGTTGNRITDEIEKGKEISSCFCLSVLFAKHLSYYSISLAFPNYSPFISAVRSTPFSFPFKFVYVPYFCIVLLLSAPLPTPFARHISYVSQKVREGRLCAGMWRRDRHSGGVVTGGRSQSKLIEIEGSRLLTRPPF